MQLGVWGWASAIIWPSGNARGEGRGAEGGGERKEEEEEENERKREGDGLCDSFCLCFRSLCCVVVCLSVSAKVTIPKVANARQDVELVVHSLVHLGREDLERGERVAQCTKAFGGCDKREEDDLVLSNAVLEKNADRHQRCRSCSDERIHQQDMALADVLGQLAVDELREQKYMTKRGSKREEEDQGGKERKAGDGNRR